MNRNKVFSDLKPVGDNKKHAFPYDRRDVYSIKAGMLNPVFVLDTIPDSSYDINSVNIIRTDAIQSTPFARMSSNMEYHFVPYSQLFRDFEKIYYERGDNQRNNYNQQNLATRTKLPTFDYRNFFNASETYFAFGRIVQDMYDVLMSKYPDNENTRITYFNLINGQEEDTISFASFQLALQFCEQFLGIKFHGQGLFDVGSLPFDIFGRPCIEDVLRNFDMLGYGNLEAIFDAAYKVFVKMDYRIPFYLGEQEYGVTQGNESYYTYENLILTYVDYFFPDSGILPSKEIFLSTMKNNFDAIIFRYSASSIEIPFNLDVHPTVLRMAAYLKVWSDFYRNSQYDVDTNYSYFFNYDYYQDSDGDVPLSKLFGMLQPRYRQWKKDVFTGGYPNAQFGSVAVSGLESPAEIIVDNVTNVPSTGGSNINAPALYASAGVHGGRIVQRLDNEVSTSITSSTTKVSKFTIDSGISALSIRQALAMQRYRETVLRAGNRLTSLQRAQFGDTSRYLEDEYCRFLNAYSQTIDFNSVATTAEGNDRVVGELASNGVSTYGGNGFKFDSHDFGIIIGIQYILPEAEYESYGIDPMVTKSVTSDFYKAAFQNLGLAPVFGFNYNLFRLTNSSQSNGVELNAGVFSYLARYWEYKTQYDKVHGLFYNSQPFAYTYFDGQVGDFAQYVTPRPAVFEDNLSLPALYVNPNSIDSIFYKGVDNLQSSDPFKVNMNHTGTMVLPMSVIGLPNI